MKGQKTERMGMLVGVIGFFFCFMLFSSSADGAIPQQINYQGYLTSAAGVPVNGTVQMVFRIYNVESGGTDLWNEAHSVTVSQGVYNVVLGASSLLPNPITLPFDQQYYLGVTVGTDPEMAPRIPLTSVGYAFRARTVESVGSHTHSGADITSGTVAEGWIDSSIARDSEVTSAISTHTANPSAHHTRYTNAEAVAAILAADGAGSGLDADLLDGQHASAFAQSSHNHNTLYYTKAEVNDLISNLQAQITALQNLLQGVTRSSNDIYVTGANLHIRSGSGTTGGAVNGNGNLIIGYNELRGTGDVRTGSHNLIVGRAQNYSSYGGIVVGDRNTISNAFASVSGGFQNTASGIHASVSGGNRNNANGEDSSVTGGSLNLASGQLSSVNGGRYNIASGIYSSVAGGGSDTLGYGNIAFGHYTAILGGYNNTAGDPALTDHTIGQNSSVSGGQNNTASGTYSSVSGGAAGQSTQLCSSISGGWENIAGGEYSSILGGRQNQTTGGSSAVSGGTNNTASGLYSSISGGAYNASSGMNSSVSGGGGNTASGQRSSVSGGGGNLASGETSSVGGGGGNTASGEDSSVSGGNSSTASGYSSSVSGGLLNSASGYYSSVSGGYNNTASSDYSSVSGGEYNTASGIWSSVSGGYSRSATGEADWAAGGLSQDQ